MSIRSFDIFVYLGSGEAVFAGTAASVVEDGKTQGLFSYAASYLQRDGAVSLDPFNLPLPRSERENSFETDESEGLATFGAFRDSAPDSWGRERMTRVSPRDLTDLDFILASGEDRAGFLAFGEEGDSAPRIIAPWAPPTYDPTRYLDLDAMGLIIHELANSKLTPEELRRLLLYGSSLGGARPKATIKHGGRIWLAKVPRSDDGYNVPRGEHAAMELARHCEITVPETQLVTVEGKDVYLIERFDRSVRPTITLRHGMISALSAFGISENSMNVKAKASYGLLAKKISKLTEDRASEGARQKQELFRRVLFNILVSNTDDHPRNHAFLLRDGQWDQSPLYDVQPLPRRTSRPHLIMPFGVNGGEGSIHNLLSQCGDFDLSRGEAIDQVSLVLDRFGDWERFFRNAGVNERDMDGYRATFSVAGTLRSELESEASMTVAVTPVKAERRPSENLAPSSIDTLCRQCRAHRLGSERRRLHGICSYCDPHYERS